MNRIESVTTGVRPIKKLFILDPEDLDRMIEIIRLSSNEIAGITNNIVLPSNSDIYEENTARFVRQHDPDILLNYSSAETKKLERHFRLEAYSSPPIDEVRRMASTKIGIWDNLPTPFFRPAEDSSRDVFTVIADEGAPVDVFVALHFGIVSSDLGESLKNSIFHDIRVKNIDSENTFDFLHDHDHNFIYLTLGLSLASEHGASVYEKDDNPSSLFVKKPTIILGSYADVKSMIYFWNARASYPFNRTLWLPVELADPSRLNLQEYTHLASIFQGSEYDSKVKALRNGKQLIDPSRYYFPGYTNRWLAFEHTATASVIDSRLKIDHPSYKLFSRRGLNMDIALEVQGLEEMYAPPSAAAGRLFAQGDAYNPLGFRRISLRGFALRIRQFELFLDTSLHKELNLPGDYAVMKELFAERGYIIDKTRISAVMEQFRTLMGGYANMRLLATDIALRLINHLAPRRTQRIIDEIRGAGLNFTGRSERELAVRLASVPALGQQLTQTLLQLEGGLQIKRSEKSEFHSLVQKLYDKGLLLRGKSVQCVHCESKLWFPLESLSMPLRCYCCNSPTILPIAPNAEAEDSYRLNELLIQAVDQGLLAMLLTMRILWEQRFFGKRLLPSLMVYKEGSQDPLLEVDIAFTLGRDLGLCEVKSGQDFDLKQTDGLLVFAESLGADLVIFSTLRESNDRTVVAISEHIEKRGTRLPILILTRSTLLASDVPHLSEVYKREYLRNPRSVFVL